MNQLSKFMSAIALFVCFSFPVPGNCFGDDNICIIELLFENKAFSTYRAICCPGDERFTFQALPGLTTGTGCSGSHCFKEIKVQFETDIIALQENEEDDPEKRRLVVHGFQSDLERFGYDDDPMMPMEKKEIESCLKKAKFISCFYAEFKHPVSKKDVIVQIILCESKAGTPANGLKKNMHAFGFQIKELPKGMDKADVFKLDGKDIFLPTGCDRHCLIVQLGNIVAGVTLAEHRLGDVKK